MIVQIAGENLQQKTRRRRKASGEFG